jgi:hypothetical protein
MELKKYMSACNRGLVCVLSKMQGYPQDILAGPYAYRLYFLQDLKRSSIEEGSTGSHDPKTLARILKKSPMHRFVKEIRVLEKPQGSMLPLEEKELEEFIPEYGKAV